MEYSYQLAADGSMILEGLKNMVVGLAVVFSILVLLSLIIWAFKLLGRFGSKNTAAENIKPAAGSPAPSLTAAAGPGRMSEAPIEFDNIDAETAVAVLGAMASELGSDFVVTSIKKSK